MNLSNRDKRTLLIGAVLAVVVLLAVPLGGKWARMGAVLDPKRAYVRNLHEQVDGQDSLLARRNDLVRKIGSLLGPEPTEEKKESDEPPSDSEESKSKDGPNEDENKNDPGVKGQGEDKEEPEKAETEAAEDAKSGEEPDTADPGEDAENGEKQDTAEAAEDGKDKEPKSDGPPENAEESKGEQPKAERGGSSGPASPSTRSSLAAHVEYVAKESGVTIKRISPKKTRAGRKSGKHFNPVELQVSVDATPQSFLKLLHALEKGDRFVRVERLQLRRDLQKNDAIDASLDIMAYEAVAR